MSNASNTPVLSPGDYLKIKAIKIHLDDTGMEKIPSLPNSILTSIFQKVSLSIPPLTSSGLGFVQSRRVTKLK